MTQEQATSTAPIVNGVDFLTVCSSDLAASEEFYGTVLGLPRSSVYQRGDAPAVGLEFETGSLTLSVVHSQALGIEYRPNNHPIALHVDDMEAARAELEARGVVFAAATMDTGVCHMSHFRDPDGNALMLHHRYAPRS
ncbi:MAG TPA: VOC family protein [Baekduia sp.]|uniref:VOC family protein n=1 Tax=Baekduia sp. TaxID=2600305 RepID=UPI002CA8A429|nr:VOC family protein [Baekduia sp.]HMJ37055.1 VOC family protein [Baekduia sp.]